MTLHYRLDPEDIGNFTKWYYAQMDDGKKLIRRATVGLTAILLAMSFVAVLRAPSSLQWIVSMFVALICVFFAVVYPRRLRSSLQKTAMKAISKPENIGFLGPKTLEINEEGLISISEAATALYKWSAIHKITATSDYAFLMVGGMQALTIPRAKIEDGNLDAFVAEANRLHQMANSNKVVAKQVAV